MGAVSATILAIVISVHDGDSMRARTADGQILTIRLAHIDAPELSQPYGLESRDALRALCLRKVAKIVAIGRDHFRRTIATVDCSNHDAGVQQVQNGNAWAFARYAPPVEITNAQQFAKLGHIGLWQGTDQAIAPWRWRRLKQHITEDSKK